MAAAAAATGGGPACRHLCASGGAHCQREGARFRVVARRGRGAAGLPLAGVHLGAQRRSRHAEQPRAPCRTTTCLLPDDERGQSSASASSSSPHALAPRRASLSPSIRRPLGEAEGDAGCDWGLSVPMGVEAEWLLNRRGSSQMERPPAFLRAARLLGAALLVGAAACLAGAAPAAASSSHSGREAGARAAAAAALASSSSSPPASSSSSASLCSAAPALAGARRGAAGAAMGGEAYPVAQIAQAAELPGVPAGISPMSLGERLKYEVEKLANLGREPGPEMAYGDFWKKASEGQLDAVFFLDTRVHLLAIFKDGTEAIVAYPPDPDLLTLLADKDVTVLGEPRKRLIPVIGGFARTIAPFALVHLLGELYFRVDDREMGAWSKQDDVTDLYSGEVPRSFLGLTLFNKKVAPKKPVTLRDIAGLDAVIDNIRELIFMMNNTEEVLKSGMSKIPTGVLLVGRPGCGKTLLARAIAGETKRSFITAAGTSFTDMFQGSGAARVTALFAKARYFAPATVFIDEFDAMAQQRGSVASRDAGTHEREATVNQLLIELDGFADRSDIVVLAATNRPSVLDKAVIRAGRFDMTIEIPPPDANGREQILKVHARNKTMEPDVDWREIAYRTGGMSGADLANLLNEAGFDAVRLGRAQIGTENVLNALDKVKGMFFDGSNAEPGSASRAAAAAAAAEDEDDVGVVVTAEERRILSASCAGKALMGCLLEEYDDLSKVTVPLGSKGESFVVFLPEEKYLTPLGHYTRGYMKRKMAVGLAGRVGEMLAVGEDNVTFCHQDLVDVSNMAREFVMVAGFSPRIGPVMLLREKGDRFLSGDFEWQFEKFSPQMMEVADHEVRRVVAEAFDTAMAALKANEHILKAMVDALVERGTLSGKEVQGMIDEMGGQRVKEEEFVRDYDDEGRLINPPPGYGEPVGIGGDVATFLEAIRLQRPPQEMSKWGRPNLD